MVHCNISARSVLVGRDLTDVKLAKLGNCRSTARQDYYLRFSAKLDYKSNVVRWKAPELFKASAAACGHETDVWSFGVLMWEVFSAGRRPYGRMTPEEVMHAVTTGHVADRIGDIRQWSDNCPKLAIKFMHQCWSMRPVARPKFSMLCASLRIAMLPPQQSADLIRAQDGAADIGRYRDASAVAVLALETAQDRAASGNTCASVDTIEGLTADWGVPRAAVKRISLLGTGAFGEVILVAVDRDTVEPGCLRSHRRLTDIAGDAGYSSVFAAAKSLTCEGYYENRKCATTTTGYFDSSKVSSTVKTSEDGVETKTTDIDVAVADAEST